MSDSTKSDDGGSRPWFERAARHELAARDDTPTVVAPPEAIVASLAERFARTGIVSIDLGRSGLAEASARLALLLAAGRAGAAPSEIRITPDAPANALKMIRLKPFKP